MSTCLPWLKVSCTHWPICLLGTVLVIDNAAPCSDLSPEGNELSNVCLGKTVRKFSFEGDLIDISKLLLLARSES